MRVPTMMSVNKFCAMLCIALALVFAGASLASAVDRMQHGPGGSPAHEHMPFSDISLEDAHDQDHPKPDQGGEDPSDRDRESVVEGTRVYVRVDQGGRRINKKKKRTELKTNTKKQ